METEVLERIGLTKGEIKVYFALLELGATTTGPLVDASGVSSSKIYLVLDRLMRKGLVSYFLQKKKKYFEAADPRRIVDFLQEREKELSQQKSEMERLLPGLLKRRELTKEKRQATVFKGMNGVETAYENILQELGPGDEYYVLSAPQAFPSEFRRFLNRHHQRRERQRIRVKMMLSEKLRPTLGADRASNKYVELKYLPQGLILSETILIYNDKAFTIVWGKEPVVFLLESKEYADSMRMFFELLWNEETRTYRGMDGLASAYQTVLDALKPGEEYYIINTSTHTPPSFRSFIKEFHKKRQAKGIRLKTIYSENLKPTIGGDRETEKNTEVKYVSSGITSPQGIIIFKDSVLTILWGKEPVVFIVKSKEYANAMKMFFDILWDQDVKTYRGEDGLKALLESELEVSECRFIGSGGYFYDVLPRDYVDKYLKKVTERGIVWKTLGMKEFKNHPVYKLPFNEVRYLSGSVGPSVTWIWGNKVANVVWSKKPTSFIAAFVTENQETADNFRKYLPCCITA
ncbi:MAG: helix-turn-helix domain-containing protein [Candidatus Micrarchaeota archaeon]